MKATKKDVLVAEQVIVGNMAALIGKLDIRKQDFKEQMDDLDDFMHQVFSLSHTHYLSLPPSLSLSLSLARYLYLSLSLFLCLSLSLPFSPFLSPFPHSGEWLHGANGRS